MKRLLLLCLISTASAQTTYEFTTIPPTITNNTVLGNGTSATAAPQQLAVGTCSSSSSALKWTTNTGFGCNTSINAATLLTGTWAAPGAIGSGTPSSGAFTTLTSSSGMPLSSLATQATNTITGNGTNATAVPTALPIGTCSTSSSALIWTTNTGFGCNTAVNATTVTANSVANAGLAQMAAHTMKANSTTATANASDIQIGPVTVFSWGVPMIIPSSGTIGNNGALSAIVTLGHQYASCYMFFPAGKICSACTASVGGAGAGNPSAAGFYYVVMSSVTAGTIKNNIYTSGIPAIPASPTALTETGPGGYTQTITALTMITLTIPGGLVGPNGRLIFESAAARQSGTDTNHVTMVYGGSTIGDWAVASQQWYGMSRHFQNLGLTNANNIFSNASLTVGSDQVTVNTGTNLLAIDTESNQTFTITATAPTAISDWTVLFGGTITAQYAP